MATKPAFIITIDTEPDNQWLNESFDKTENARYLPRFQELCEKYGFKPVYLTEYNMAADSFFVDYMNEKLEAGKCEIGMHLHPWSTPPFIQITPNDCKAKPYVTDYPLNIIEKKIETLVNLLRSKFKGDIISHRAGRWAISTEYIRILKRYGITIDCSVLPYHVIPPSSPTFSLGVDYSDCNSSMYEINDSNYKTKGTSGFFEIPPTVFDFHPFLRTLTAMVSSMLSARFFGRRVLRPDRGNLLWLLRLTDYAKKKKLPFIEFMLHSSELMPGCSPVFPDRESVENLYNDLDILFRRIARNFEGMTLKEYVSQTVICKMDNKKT